MIYFRKMGKFIENLGISNCYFDPVAFKELLENTPNLNSIKICYVNFTRTKSLDLAVSHRFKPLRKLHVSSYTPPFSGEPDVLATILGSSACLNNIYLASERIDSWSIFLMNQKRLENLHIESDNIPRLDLAVKFQLKELTMNLGEHELLDVRNFKSFVKFQKQLVKLTLMIRLEDNNGLWLEYNQILQHLLSLRSLRSLTLLRNEACQSITNYPFSKHTNLRSLMMEIKTFRDHNVLKNFPDLKTLKINFCNRNVDISKVLSEVNKLEHLRELYIQELKAKFLHIIEIPNLRKFSIQMHESTIFPKTWKKFLDNNPSLEQLELLYVREMTSEAINTITLCGVNLKQLKIVHFFDIHQLTNQIFKIILRNCPKMQLLELYAGNCNEDLAMKAQRYLENHLTDLKCWIHYPNEDGHIKCKRYFLHL